MVFLDRDHNGVELADSIYNALSSVYQIHYFASTLDLPYPLIAKNMVNQMRTMPGAVGILVCKTGIGMSIVANKYSGVFANNCKTIKECERFRKMNNGNVLCLGSECVSKKRAIRICEVFLTTAFDQSNQNRIHLISEIQHF